MNPTIAQLQKAQLLAQRGVLKAPKSFMLAGIDDLVKYCNGCGASGSRFRPPATIYGTLIIYACIIHDWCYTWGITEEDKFDADGDFMDNMNELIRLDSHKWYKPTRLQYNRVITYYEAVRSHWGDEAFWENKERYV